MSNFNNFNMLLQKQLDKMSENTLYVADVTKDDAWDTYINSFPEGSNPIYKEHTEHDCNCCKQFIHRMGRVVSIDGDKVSTIWDVEIGGHYQVVADAMRALVTSRPIGDVFYSEEKKAGTPFNHQSTEDGSIIKWEHFNYTLNKKFVIADGVKRNSKLSSSRDNKKVLGRSLTEISIEATELVEDLINQNSLYRGEEHLNIVKCLKDLHKGFAKAENKDLFLWKESVVLGIASRIKNTVIGTLLVDISNGVELEKAVKSFEAKVAPHNYKRSSALITNRMIEEAQKKVSELGIEESLKRRYARTEDLTVNNVLFADRSAKKEMGGVFSDLMATSPSKKPNLEKVEEITIDKFVKDVIPNAESLEIFVENSHTGNFVSLIAPEDSSSKNIFKWGNNFSWSYNGEVTDSMREDVVKAGGRVDGVLRFTHSWNHDGQNLSLMDLHVFHPENNHKTGINDNYGGNGERVGWNNRIHHATKGVQDVDYIHEPDKGFVPLENITYPDISAMPEGVYKMKIHNWNSRKNPRSGFKAEIEFGGEVFQYNYPKPVKHKEWIDIAEVTLKDGQFSIKHMLQESTEPKNVWGVQTQGFHKVSMVMNSPNHWDGEETGNKHWFFMMEECSNPENTRGFYNEFLIGELNQHRKVFEVLGSKLKADHSDNQLSGLGFSSTQTNHVLCKVSGKFNRLLKIKF